MRRERNSDGIGRHHVTVALCLVLMQIPLCHCAEAQTPASPAFEVASIHMVGPDHGYTKISPSGSVTFSAENTSLKYLIEVAFGVDGNQVSAKQNWLDETYYTVTARPEDNKGRTYEELRPMLQRLLAERFGLEIHREQKMVDGYALVVDKGGFKLKPADGTPTTPYIFADGLQARSITIRGFAAMLAAPLGRPVVDKTAVEGTYNLDLKFAPANAIESPLPSIFTAVQAQLGLKLVSQKVPIEMLVVDRVNRVPTAN